MLPEDYRPYIDKYFLRAKEILIKDDLNPYVKAQVFIRKAEVGMNRVYGLKEAVELIDKYSNLFKNDGNIYTLNDGDRYESKETLMVIEGYIHDINDFEIDDDQKIYIDRFDKLPYHQQVFIKESYDKSYRQLEEKWVHINYAYIYRETNKGIKLILKDDIELYKNKRVKYQKPKN